MNRYLHPVTPLAQVPISLTSEAQRQRLDAAMLRTKQNPQQSTARVMRQEANLRRLQGEAL